MSDLWEEVPVTYVGTIPRWMIDWAKSEYDDPNMTADNLVAMWVENMQENTYDVARDDGTLPVPPL